MQLAWGSKVSEEFCQLVIGICNHFGWEVPRQASDLMDCIAWETGRTFSSSVKNGAGSGATGLIQFMDPTARALGTTLENLALLTPESQLTYVQMYFEPYAKRIKTRSDMYMAIFYPIMIGKSEDSVIAVDGSIVFRQNAGFDLNKDKKITKAECAACIDKMHVIGMGDGYVRNL